MVVGGRRRAGEELGPAAVLVDGTVVGNVHGVAEPLQVLLLVSVLLKRRHNVVCGGGGGRGGVWNSIGITIMITTTTAATVS